MLIYFLAIVFSFCAASWWLVWLLIPKLSIEMLDRPNIRSSHSVPIPRGGGIVFVSLASTASFLSIFFVTGSTVSSFPFYGAPLLALPLALVGFFDDRYNLSVSWRYSVQVATALVILLVSPLLFQIYLY